MSSAPEQKKLHKNESIKVNSVNLRGTLSEELNDNSTGSICADSAQLSKFHGMYMQDDRDIRAERRKKKLEKAFSFMLRVRIPAGVVSSEQYLKLDQLADDYANGMIRLTTRQTIQYHGLLKGNIRNLIRGMDEVGVDSIGACGDINRNVMAYNNVSNEKTRLEMHTYARKISEQFMPEGKAYYDLFIDGEKVTTEAEVEPIYGKTYLPRKFKIGIAVPPSNDVDVFSQDLGLIAIYKGDKLEGFNISAGGGMGTTHGNTKTFARVADVLGFVKPEDVHKVAEAIVTTQRDFGDRTDRAHARLKYTIADRGVEWFIGEVESRSGVTFEKAREFKFETIVDDFGWHKDVNGDWYYGQFIASGRIKDTAECQMKKAFQEIAKIHVGDWRMTGSQNMVICGVSEGSKAAIEKILADHGVPGPETLSGLRKNALACVALPTCGLALAESERALPSVIDDIEDILDEVGLRETDISIRMTGCPNGCARPFLGEIGFVGKAPGKYNMYLGANYEGLRLNTLYAESIKVDEALEKLKPIIKQYAAEREEGERFGDFCVRKEIVTIAEKDSVKLSF
ncbi:NADPH-dependent assimilatory sulfite reductase hemoprotein subunit [Puniceicoccaceae bacterium K14]|nr:NADPH-dependent assimilatory sulfite reductase hemoprotein subunit [Puniceicoccaceae bacterium K14]